MDFSETRQVVINSGYLAALLRDARILVFDQKAGRHETSKSG